MRLVTYATQEERPRAGVVVESDGRDVVVDIERASGGQLPADLLLLLETDGGLERTDALSTDDAVPLEEVRLLAPLRRPTKLLATAGNYQAHIVEGGLPPVDKRRIVPKLFLKPASAIIGPDDTLRLPRLSQQVDWELELAAVIGRRAKNVRETDALSYVAGYTIINDISARNVDWGIERDATHFDSFFDWLNGKWLDGFAPMGPWLSTVDETPDPQGMRLRLTVNGVVRQDGSTAEMIFGVGELIAFASRLMTLEPGDVIATGTPAGVGDTAGTYLRPGDVMECEVEHIGILRTVVEGLDRA